MANKSFAVATHLSRGFILNISKSFWKGTTDSMKKLLYDNMQVHTCIGSDLTQIDLYRCRTVISNPENVGADLSQISLRPVIHVGKNNYV